MPIQFKFSPARGFILASMACCAPAAATEPEPLAALQLDPIVVVASKAPRPLSEVAGQVSVIDAEHLRRHLLTGMDELLRYEPGVETDHAGTRFGVTGFNIRGIGGNRVAIEVDGVPLRNGFAIGSYSNGGQDLVETGLIERVEVLYGPASSLYGSDALAGVLAITTWDPDDLVAMGEGDRWLGLTGQWRESDQSTGSGIRFAQAAGAHGWLVSAMRRQGGESRFSNPAGVASDPRDWTSEDYFARYVFDTPAANRFRLTAERYQREGLTELRSILGAGRFRSTTALQGDDQDRVSRILLDYEFAGAGWEHGVARLFHSRSETRQLTLEERLRARIPSAYRREFEFDTRQLGLELTAFRSFARGRADHRLGVGLERQRVRTEELRDGFQQSLVDGSITRTVLGESLPVRDFPNAVVTETGLFVQDEISIGAWEIVPALRWDRYHLDPRPDAIYLEDYPDTEIVGSTRSRITPRLGLVRRLGRGWSAYGQYVEGFRAPPHEDVNIGLDLSVFRYRAIPNPDLRSETSQGVELGVRHFTAERRFSVAAFETRYEDFIESRVPLGLDPLSGYLLFQSRNIDRARIRGLDVRLDQDLGPGWAVNAALSWSRGDNLQNGRPLNTVSPPQLVLGLSWDSPDRAWYASLTGTFTRRQDRVDHAGTPRFETPGWAVYDLAVGRRFGGGISLDIGIRNLADKHYWRWSDIASLSIDDPMLPLLARPGRNVTVALGKEW